MAYGMNDRVREQVSGFGGGTGALTLPVSAVTGFQTFLAGWGASGTGEYAIVSGAQWEVGFGTLNAGATTLTRTTVYNGSSGAGVAVNFTAGTMDCFGDVPAELAHYLNQRPITVASAATCDIGAVKGSAIVISGAVTITSFGTSANRRRFVIFSGAPLLTNNDTSLILPHGDNIQVTAGDTATFVSDASGNWTCVASNRWFQNVNPEDYLINGNGQVQQTTLGSTADDVYSHDQWYALTQTAALTTSQLTDVEDGVPQMMRLTQGQASAQRIGYAQILEGQRCKKLRGKRVTIGGRLRYSNAAAVRFAILEWTGTVDAVTSDVVNDWTSGTFTAGNFFNSTTLTVRAVGTITPGAATLTDYRLSATLGSSFNNLIVLIWTEGTAAQNSTLDFVMQLKPGFVVTPFVMRPYDQELLLCKRYLQVITTPSAAVMLTLGQCQNTTNAFWFWRLEQPMRAGPTGITVSSAAHFAALNTSLGVVSLATLTFGATDANVVQLAGVVASGLTAGAATILYGQNASGRIAFTGAQL